MSILLSIYRSIFCHNFLYKFNYHLNRLSLRGIGILNSEGNSVTGEEYFLHKLKNRLPLKTVFDIGANTGEYIAEIRKSFPLADIYAFEPHPLTFKRLNTNIKDKNTKIFNIGLGDKLGKAKLWDFADDANLKSTQPTSTLASLQKEVIGGLHGQKAQAFNVQITTVDEVVRKEKLEEISLLKIDTEGTELDVLNGAKETLKKNKIVMVQFEFNEMNVYSRVFMKDFVDLLPNYTFFRLMPHGLYPMGEYRPSSWEIFAFQNILVVRNDILGKIDL